jgi:polar amino acid transport system permease protein
MDAMNEAVADPNFKSRALPMTDGISRWPWWAIAVAILAVLIAWGMLNDAKYNEILGFISRGIGMTLLVTIVAYTFAIVLGLLIGLGRTSRNPIIYQVCTFYVEIIRGLPTLVLLLYIAFSIFPLTINWLNQTGYNILNGVNAAARVPFHLGSADFSTQLFATGFVGDFGRWLTSFRLRDVDNTVRVIIALTIAYSAFLAEIFRGGIQSIERGQTEAGMALGMSGWQVMWHVVLRQAFRRVLPPLGNDFIAMLKDSSLVSALGVLDITRLGVNYQARTFLTIETYSVVAFLYLIMTLLLSLVVKGIERYVSRENDQRSRTSARN